MNNYEINKFLPSNPVRNICGGDFWIYNNKNSGKIKLSIILSKHVNNNDLNIDGYIFGRVDVGKCFRMVDENNDVIFSTTPVIEIYNDNIFKTFNTVYKIEY